MSEHTPQATPDLAKGVPAASVPDGGIWDGPADRCRMELVHSATICHSGSWCVRNDLHVGHDSGGSFMRSPTWTPRRTVYVRFWLKWRNDFHFDTLGKVMFFKTDSINDWYLRWGAVDGTHARVGINATAQGGYDACIPPNLDTTAVTVDRWYEFQWQTTLSSSDTACDGSVDVWVGTTHTFHRDGMCKAWWPNGIDQLVVSGYYNGTATVPSTYWIDDIDASDSFIP